MKKFFFFLAGVLIFFVFIFLLIFNKNFFQKTNLISQPEENQKVDEETEFCFDSQTGEKMGLAEAKKIASASKCLKEGSLEKTFFCNENTGTWWLDLKIDKPGCAPACVVSVSTGKAEINWRCTGLINP